MCKYVIHYFSGTGNTYHMAKRMENEIKSKGYEVELLNIENDKLRNLSDYNMHIFCFPVYGFGAPSIMLKYISNVSIETGSKAAIVCTSAGVEGQSLEHTKQILNKNGFEVFFTDMVVYTYNFTQIMNPESKEIEEKFFKEAEVRIAEITSKIINDESSFKKINSITLILYWGIFILFTSFGRRILGKTFIADDTCVNCGKCKAICPVKAIDMYNGKPIWNSNCESCQRCINMCPKESIQLSIMKLVIFVISELIPILIIVYLNKYIYHLSITINIFLYCIMVVINTIIANNLIYMMEKISLFRKIFEISYTKKYRRNTAIGFNIK